MKPAAQAQTPAQWIIRGVLAAAIVACPWAAFADVVPFYRLYNPNHGDHLFTTDSAEQDSAATSAGYISEGIAAYVFDTPANGSIPLYRLYNSDSGDHFYTTAASERDSAVGPVGYVYEGIAAYVLERQEGESVPLHRLYSPRSGDHLYTTDDAEIGSAASSGGYVYEGIAAYVFRSPPAPSRAVTSASRPRGFQILVDVNQLDPSEADQDAVLAADGVWAITENSPGIPAGSWPAALARLNAGNWTVAEDNPSSSYEVDAVGGYIGRPVDASLCYMEPGIIPRPGPNGPALDATYDTILTPDEITAQAAAHGNRIIILSRSYRSDDPRRDAANTSLSQPAVSGIAFETSPDEPGSTMWNQQFNDGINYCLSLGKKCYVLLPPKPGSTNYLKDIEAAMSYFAQSGQLANPNLYIVPAVYSRPDSKVGFLKAAVGADAQNTLLAAVNWLKSYRDNLAPRSADGTTPQADRPAIVRPMSSPMRSAVNAGRFGTRLAPFTGVPASVGGSVASAAPISVLVPLAGAFEPGRMAQPFRSGLRDAVAPRPAPAASPAAAAPRIAGSAHAASGGRCVDDPAWYSLHQIGTANTRAPAGPPYPADISGYDTEHRYGYRAEYDFADGPRKDVIACQLTLDDNKTCLQSYFPGPVGPGPNAQWRRDWRTNPYFRGQGQYPPKAPTALPQRVKFWLPAGTVGFLLRFGLPQQEPDFAAIRLGRPPEESDLVDAPAAPLPDQGTALMSLLLSGATVKNVHDGGGWLVFAGATADAGLGRTGMGGAPGLDQGAWLYAYLSGPQSMLYLNTMIDKSAFQAEYADLRFKNDGDPICR